MALNNRIKVIARIKGGLGNQLFIYAASRRFALSNDADLVLDDQSGFAFDVDYQRHYQLDRFNIKCPKANLSERLEPFSRIRRAILRKWSYARPPELRRCYNQIGNQFDPSFLNIKPRKNFYIEGYFQSEGYFKDVEDVIRNDLKIIPPTDSANLEIAHKIRSVQSVAIHVRYFDNTNARSLHNTPANYYSQAIKKISSINPNAYFFVFSDRPEFASTLVGLPDSRVTYISHNQGDSLAYADLWLMTLCKDFIIANSTFSWWGAWLSENPNKTVIVPGFNLNGQLTSWGFDGLIPNDWIKL